jgi:hypothetical protein
MKPAHLVAWMIAVAVAAPALARPSSMERHGSRRAAQEVVEPSPMMTVLAPKKKKPAEPAPAKPAKAKKAKQSPKSEE